MAQWKIDRRGGACAVCEEPFEEGQRHLSTLAFHEEELSRDDVCEGCWATRETPGGPEELIWWSTRHQAERKRTVQLDLASLEKLFVELEGREETHVRELRYVLCLILMRKRRVKIDKIERSEEEGESFLVKRPRHDVRHRVYVFDFSAERMEELRGQLQSVFDGLETEGGGEGDADDEAHEAAGELQSD